MWSEECYTGVPNCNLNLTYITQLFIWLSVELWLLQTFKSQIGQDQRRKWVLYERKEYVYIYTHVCVCVYIYMKKRSIDLVRMEGEGQYTHIDSECFTTCQCSNTPHRWYTKTLTGFIRSWDNFYPYLPRIYIFFQSAHANKSGQDSVWFGGKVEAATHWSST